MNDARRRPITYHASCARIAPSTANLARALRAQVRHFAQNKRKRRTQIVINTAQLARANSALTDLTFEWSLSAAVVLRAPRFTVAEAVHAPCSPALNAGKPR
jgi:hypothetical protein